MSAFTGKENYDGVLADAWQLALASVFITGGDYVLGSIFRAYM
jgi:hypothetical protein